MSIEQLREMLRESGDKTLRELAYLQSAKSKTVPSYMVANWKAKEKR